MASTAYLLSLRKFKCFNVHRVFGRDTTELRDFPTGLHTLCTHFKLRRVLASLRILWNDGAESAIARYGDDAGFRVSLQEIVNPRQGRSKCAGYLVALKIARRQDECLYAPPQQSCLFATVISESVVLGENDPSFFAHIGEPFFIRCVGWEAIVVDFDCSTR